jgi:hypothetical protein
VPGSIKSCIVTFTAIPIISTDNSSTPYVSINHQDISMYLFTLGVMLGAASASNHFKRASTSNFQVYAYGEGIGGLPVFSSGCKHQTVLKLQ